jgi:hypothetical protein
MEKEQKDVELTTISIVSGKHDVGVYTD